jgi:hypothetical protein
MMAIARPIPYTTADQYADNGNDAVAQVTPSHDEITAVELLETAMKRVPPEIDHSPATGSTCCVQVIPSGDVAAMVEVDV